MESKLKMNNKDRLFKTVCYCVAVFLAAIALFPFLYILFVSLSDRASIAAGNLLSADNQISFSSYIGLFRYGSLSKSFLNSLILSFCGVFLNMLFTIPCAYALSRKETKGKKWIYGFLILAMFFRGEIIPTYVWMSSLGLVDSYLAVWLSKLVSIYNILILAKYFETLPQDVLNAAKLDGAGPMQILLKFALPMSKTILFSIGIIYFATWWNDYYYTMIYIRDPSKFTLPVRIIQMIANIEDSSIYSTQDLVYAKLSAYGIRAAGIVLSILPMLLLVLIAKPQNTLNNPAYNNTKRSTRT